MKKGGKNGFLFTLLGAATGLGNALRFPGLCLADGGGTFVFAYAVALVSVCYPLLRAELSLGKNRRRTFPQSLEGLCRRGGRVGWAACLNSALIAIYYGAIISRLALTAIDIYPLYTQGNRVVPEAFAPVIASAAWLLMFFILRGGVGILSVTSRFTIFFSLALFCLLAARGVSMNGAEAALALFVPELGALSRGKIWADAFGQALLALSLAAGVIPALSESMPENTDLSVCAAKIIAANFLGCILTSVALLSPLYNAGAAELISESGLSTAFGAYPAAILSAFPKPAVAGAFGTAFYLSLTAVAVQSAMSLSGAAVGAMGEKLERSRAAGALCIAGALLSPLFAIYPRLLEACDKIACSVNAFTVAFIESLIFSGNLPGCGLRLKYVCPAVFGALAFLSFSGCGGGIAACFCAATALSVCLFAFFPAWEKFLRRRRL